MNSYNKRAYQVYIVFIPLIFISISSCKKVINSELETKILNDGIAFEISGFNTSDQEEVINEDEQANQQKGNYERKAVSTVKKTTENYESELMSFDEFDAMMVLKEEEKPTLNNSSKKLLKSNSTPSTSNLKAASTAMGPNKTYMVVLYEADDQGNPTSYLAQGKGKVGSKLIIKVQSNTHYRWFAYSFNNSKEISNFNPSNPNVAVKASADPDNQNSDFLYATGTVKTNANYQIENPVPITFLRKTALVNLELNARGIFGPITAGHIKIPSSASGFKDGTFHIINGNYSSISNAATIINTSWINPENSNAPANWVKQKGFYTVPQVAATKFTVNLDSVKLTTTRINDNSPNTSSTRNRIFYVNNFEFPSITLREGRRYLASIQIVESAISIAGSRWARGNLYYEKNTAGNEYRIRYDNPHFRNFNGGISNIKDTDYWSTGLKPTESSSSGADPCAEIFPKGKWTLPTTTQYYNLIDYTAIKATRRNQFNNEGWYVTWDNATAHISGHPHGHLIFTALGYYNSANIITDFNYAVGSTENTSTNYGDKGYFRTKTANEYFTLYFRTSNTNKELGLDVENFIGTRRTMIRCVRK